MEPGRLNRSVIVQRRSSSVDAYGQPSTTWTTLKTIWAHFIALDSYERNRAGRVVKARAGKFLIRYDSAITEKDRFSFDGSTWNIIGIAEKQKGAITEISAEALE